MDQDREKHKVPKRHRKASKIELDKAQTRELHDLCSRIYDEVITDEEMARLDRMLHESSLARMLYFRYVALHKSLLTKVGVYHEGETELLRRHVMLAAKGSVIEKLAECSVEPSFASTSTQAKLDNRRYLRLPVSLAVTASLLILAGASLYWVVNRRNDSLVTANKDPLQEPTNAVDVLEKLSPVAQLSHIFPTAKWTNRNEAFSQRAAVRPGNVLALSEGEVELIYSSGTKLLLIGPVEFVVEATGGKLRRGGVVASVTEAGHGFTIETPNGKVVDLGTEFGVAVDDFGVSEVNVFQGKVEAFPQGKRGLGKKYELTKGRGLQWNEDDLIPLDADLRRFAISVLDLSADGDSAEGNLSLVDQFRLATLDLDRWKSLGEVETSTTGLKLVGGKDPIARPYLISAEQFDPSEGPITITCDFSFQELDSADHNSFSILTRSADERGIAKAPWTDILATCARCSFGSEPGSQSGRLQAGVKLESNRELSSISWSGFVAPEAETLYRVVMRDDGVNVSYTVSLLDEPSTSKTVTYRSLFRGKANFVAIEGSLHGTTIIDRVEISQEISTRPLTSYADFSSILLDDRKQREQENSLFAKLAPAGKDPILEEHFDSDLLDGNQWDFLGDVTVHDGIAQLGQPNAEGHIDTWKARPYLLTRLPLDPKSGRLTILGKITFADNFLAGYGASFAVMTRADNQRGTGPGWENTVLQRGVRANFWPAAWNSKHNLEIHVKPTSKSIALLATQGLQVNPNVRSYLFRVVDDGRSVTLTIVDPQKADEWHTISSSAHTPVNHGFIGFESCWGSPVTLDDIRIYRDNDSAEESVIHAKD